MDAVTKGFEGDAVRRAEKGDGGAAEELARFQLLQAKLKVRADYKGKTGTDLETAEYQVLGQLSEEETVAIEVLTIINKFPESSAEAAQIAEQTQTRNRFAQARYIAERIVAQQRAKAFYDTYGPDKGTTASEFYTKQQAGLKMRIEKATAAKVSAEAKKTTKSGASAAVTTAMKALFP